MATRERWLELQDKVIAACERNKELDCPFCSEAQKMLSKQKDKGQNECNFCIYAIYAKKIGYTFLSCAEIGPRHYTPERATWHKRSLRRRILNMPDDHPLFHNKPFILQEE